MLDPITGVAVPTPHTITLYPAKHYITPEQRIKPGIAQIEIDLEKRIKQLKDQGKLIEAQRIEQRVNYDLEMLKEYGHCNGIENYSRYFDGREVGEAPHSLIEFFPKDFLMIVDESHITLPQIRGMYNGDRARKETLIDFGFRLPSALDNRPLKYDEFFRRINQAVYVSATPDEYELSLAAGSAVNPENPMTKKQMAENIKAENRVRKAEAKELGEVYEPLDSGTNETGLLRDLAVIPNVAQQLIRPTGIVDPEIEIRKSEGQIADVLKEVEARTSKGQRVLITTLTKRMAEDLSEYLEEHKVKVNYLHSDIETLKRSDILNSLRLGEYDVLVGINLLREGLDLPEVSLVIILDADKEGFLRSRTSLIQTMGRAARHMEGKVIMYADHTTKSMQLAIDEVNRRRDYQLAYNKKHNITPKSIEKGLRDRLIEKVEEEEGKEVLTVQDIPLPDRKKMIAQLEAQMQEAAALLDFEAAARLRDQIKELQA
jgi:excinuclease ABC subunit B